MLLLSFVNIFHFKKQPATYLRVHFSISSSLLHSTCCSTLQNGFYYLPLTICKISILFTGHSKFAQKFAGMIETPQTNFISIILIKFVYD